MPGRAPLPRLQAPKPKLPFQTACSNCLVRTVCSQIACLKLPGDTPSCLALCPYPDSQRKNQSCLADPPAPAACAQTACSQTACLKLPDDKTSCLALCPDPEEHHRNHHTRRSPSPLQQPNAISKIDMVRLIQCLIYDVDRVIFAPF